MYLRFEIIIAIKFDWKKINLFNATREEEIIFFCRLTLIIVRTEKEFIYQQAIFYDFIEPRKLDIFELETRLVSWYNSTIYPKESCSGRVYTAVAWAQKYGVS